MLVYARPHWLHNNYYPTEQRLVSACHILFLLLAEQAEGDIHPSAILPTSKNSSAGSQDSVLTIGNFLDLVSQIFVDGVRFPWPDFESCR